MRSTYFTGALVALFTAAVLPLVPATSASAQVAAARALPAHEIIVKDDVKVGPRTFKLKIRVATAPSERAKVFRKTGPAGFKLYKKPKIGDTGRLTVFVTGRRGDCFKLQVPATATHKKTSVRLGCLV